MRNLLALACATLLASGCSPPVREAAVIVYLEGYDAEIFLDNNAGITAPDGLLWRDGTLYIADEGGSAIRAWNGDELVTLADSGDGLISPEDLRFDAAGTLWFTDDSAGGAWRIIAGGAERVDHGMIAESEGIARHRSGGMSVGDGKSGTIYRVDAQGATTPVKNPAVQISKPESMALASDGSVFIADNRDDRLIHIGADKTATVIALPSDLSPETIALDGDSLWITDSHNGRIYRLEPDGLIETVALFIGDLANVSGIAVGAGGAIFVSVQADLDAGRGYVVKLAPKHGGG